MGGIFKSMSPAAMVADKGPAALSPVAMAVKAGPKKTVETLSPAAQLLKSK